VGEDRDFLPNQMRNQLEQRWTVCGCPCLTFSINETFGGHCSADYCSFCDVWLYPTDSCFLEVCELSAVSGTSVHNYKISFYRASDWISSTTLIHSVNSSANSVAEWWSGIPLNGADFNLLRIS
jgi:hypothetical protein